MQWWATTSDGKNEAVGEPAGSFERIISCSPGPCRNPVQCVCGLNLKWPIIVPVRAVQSFTLTPSCAVVNVGLKEAWNRGVDVPR